MIERYSLPELTNIWSDENKYSLWLEIELLAVEAQAKIGNIPGGVAEEIREKAGFEVARIQEIENEVHHDVIAFLTNVAEHVGEQARYIHYGMTSSDVLDTALAIQMKQAGELILNKMKGLSESLKNRAHSTKNMITIGRSHGIHAEPTTFGLKFTLWYDEMNRQIKRFANSIDEISVGQISGAVGTYDHISPQVEEYVCSKLGLKPANVSTQILQRDRHAAFMNSIALVGATLEKIAVEIRHLQRTEVLEAEESFVKGQKGSSAMPHKKNPIICERISGMARMLRGNAHTAMENIALWHERDISHSSVERMILPDSTMILYYMLVKTIGLIDNLVLYPENMKKNLNLTNGLIYSQAILLELTKRGVSREVAYDIVQKNAMKCWETKTDFVQLLVADEKLLNFIPEEEIRQICKLENRLKNIDYIFKKVGIF